MCITMVIFEIVILILHLIASVIFEANVNPPFHGGFLLSSDNSKVCFEYTQNRFKCLKTPCPLL